MKKNTKKIYSFFLLMVYLLTSIVLLSSCNNESSESESEGNSNALTFFAYQPDTQAKQDAYKSLIAKFTEQTGIDVKVNFVSKDDYNTSIRTALLSTKKPDIAYLDQPLTSNFVYDGYLADLTDKIAASETLSTYEYFKGAYDTTVIGGKKYAVPFTITTSVLFVNNDLVSEPIDSWNEWLGLTVPTGNALFEGVGSGGYASWYYQVFLENVGGKFMADDLKTITFNSEKGIEAAKMLQDLYAKSDKNVRNTNNCFGQGLVLTKLGSSSDIENLGVGFPNLSFSVQMIPPVSEGGTSYSNIGGENLVVFENCKNKDNAVKFIEFLMNENSQKEISKISGNFSTVKKFATVDESDPYYDMKQTVISQLETACPRPAVPAWIDINDNYLGTALETILDDGATSGVIKDALDRAANQAKAKLDQYK
jgi:ABC-type glycerol-3-phosphate transport system substrate-binding protein